jgi:excisionase family DNA binding protein
MPLTLSNERLLTAVEAAALLRVKPQTMAIWRSSHRHALPYIRVGSSIRYRLSDLQRWLQERTVTPTATE